MLVVEVILAAIVCYLAGAIPTAYLLVKWVKGIDVRGVGSGNVGATNAGRALGQWAFALVLVLDALKGFIPIYIVRVWLELPLDGVLVCATCTFLGHMYPVYLKFTGGKGVATGLGVFFALAPVQIGLAALVFIFVVAVTKMISAGSCIAAFVLGAAVTLSSEFSGVFTLFTWAVALVIVYRHRGNIKRIMDGNENKISFGNSKSKKNSK
ncbi:glycerol-3-phosphate 1-O-acyltransferase PlsY [Deferribacterales bacterium RsTz2092]